MCKDKIAEVNLCSQTKNTLSYLMTACCLSTLCRHIGPYSNTPKTLSLSVFVHLSDKQTPDQVTSQIREMWNERSWNDWERKVWRRHTAALMEGRAWAGLNATQQHFTSYSLTGINKKRFWLQKVCTLIHSRGNMKHLSKHMALKLHDLWLNKGKWFPHQAERHTGPAQSETPLRSGGLVNGGRKSWLHLLQMK